MRKIIYKEPLMLKGQIEHRNGYWHLTINRRQERFVTLDAALDAWNDESMTWAAEQVGSNSVEYLDEGLEIVE